MSIKNQPEFEAETETMTKEDTMTSTVKDNTDAATDAAAKAAKAATAIAKAATSAVAAPRAASKFKIAFADKDGVFDTQTVEGLALAAPRIKGEQGSLFLGQADLGAEVHFELISFNHRWAIGTGSDDKEAKDYFRVSYDNKTLSSDGTEIGAYIESLVAQGFTKARKSPYMDLWGFVTWSSTNGEVPVEERQLVCLQCSQTSLGAFTAFATTRGLLESSGRVQPLEVIGVRAMKRSSGSNKYTNYEFFAPKAA